MRKILILAFTNLKHDARVSRQIDFIKKNYAVTVVCFEAADDPDYEIIRIAKTNLTLFRKAISSFFLITRLYNVAYRLLHNYSHLKKQLAHRGFDLVIANDIESLPLAFQLAPQAKVLFDAHEFAPRHFEDKLIWRIFFQGFNKYLCRKYIPKTHGMTTVGEGLANEYAKYYGVKPTLVTNATRYFDLSPSPVESNKIRMIHHGGANYSRKLELMIEMMDFLDERFTLDMMLITPEMGNAKTRNYIHMLQESIRDKPRIKILPPRRSHEIVPFINHYDVGVFLLPPVNFNYENTLPNKLFDFIQARLAIAIGPTPEMANLVKQYDIGVVSDEFTSQSLANQLKSLTKERIERFKSNTDQAAKHHNAEANEVIMTNLMKELLE
jgi:Glycosyltransferase Family 4